MGQQDLKQSDVVKDAGEHGMKIIPASLSRYLSNSNNDKRSSLTEYQILWICTRWCIRVDLIVELDEYSYEKGTKNLIPEL